MKALTVHQPYASMLADGFQVKPVENRPETISWHRYRGPIAIHAGLSRKWLPPGDDLANYPTGVVVCKGHLVACFHYERACAAFHDGKIPPELGKLGWRLPQMQFILEHPETCGPLCLVITDRMRFNPPREARGQQGLWEWTEH